MHTMNITLASALAAAVLGGVSIGLLISYPIPGEQLYVCFWALFLAIWSALLGSWALLRHVARRERVKVDEVVRTVVDHMLHDDRGLRSVVDESGR